MLKIADSILHDQHLAEDAVHNAFLYILKRKRSINIRRASSMQTQVLVEKIVTHIAMDMCRLRCKEQKAVQPLTEEVAESLPDVQDAVAQLEEAEQDSMVKRYILELPQEDQDLLELFYASKVPAKELAVLLGVAKKRFIIGSMPLKTV